MTRISGEQKTDNLHTNGLGSRRQTQHWAKKTLPICLAHERPSTHVTATNPCVDMSCSIAHPSSGVMHFIRVSIARHLLECTVMSDDAVVHGQSCPLATTLS
jgi:hypothetical protein